VEGQGEKRKTTLEERYAGSGSRKKESLSQKISKCRVERGKGDLSTGGQSVHLKKIGHARNDWTGTWLGICDGHREKVCGVFWRGASDHELTSVGVTQSRLEKKEGP